MRKALLALFLALLTLLGCTAVPSSTPTPAPSLAAPPSPTPVLASPRPVLPSPTPTLPSPTPILPAPTPALPDLLALISQDHLLDNIAALAAIQPESGWRSPATTGEREAMDYIAARLAELSTLQSLGLEVERQEFRVPVATEIWQAGLQMTVAGQDVAVPAGALQALGDRIAPALRFDSDGTLNDTQRDPVTVAGPVVLVRTGEEIAALRESSLAGSAALVDYALLDLAVMDWSTALAHAQRLLGAEPAGLVLVTRSSDQPGESHGTFLGDSSLLPYATDGTLPPVLTMRLEDLAPFGITSWDDLAQVQAARLTWDADVLSPATSSNLVARIRGSDPSQAVILGAHVDSANSPGAMDDAAGVAMLLEVARVLDAAGVRPATDLYLAWFGGEELGAYGSYHYVATHQELLDRTLLMVTVDCLTRPLADTPAELNLATWASGDRGDDQLLATTYLAQAAERYGLSARATIASRGAADNLAFATFSVPNAQLFYGNAEMLAGGGQFHYTGRIHDPYDSAAGAAEVKDVLEQAAGLALLAALETGEDQPNLRDTLPPQHRALFVASHTEVAALNPASFSDLATTLALAGYDVDAVPYSQAVTPADLQRTDLVIALPVVDYPSSEQTGDLYDEAWRGPESAALEAYVAQGGFLVLTNSAYRLDLSGNAVDPNEDWGDMNALAGRFGVTYEEAFITGDLAPVSAEHALVAGVTELAMAAGNGVGFTVEQGSVLAQVEDHPAVALVAYGEQGGQVLVLADAWMLAAGWGGGNSVFWENLGRYAREKGSANPR